MVPSPWFYPIALHELDPTFRKVTLRNARLRSLVKDLRFHRDPVALQSMVIFKQPRIGGAGENSGYLSLTYDLTR